MTTVRSTTLKDAFRIMYDDNASYRRYVVQWNDGAFVIFGKDNICFWDYGKNKTNKVFIYNYDATAVG